MLEGNVKPDLAPIALFVYCRPDHTKQTVEALLRNPEAASSDLIVYSDAPANTLAEESVAQVRGYVREITGFRTLKVIERESNLGLAASIINGVSQQLQLHGQLIVMEDDLVVSPFFLSFMNEGLRRYVNDERVASIHGYMYPIKIDLPEAIFLQGADCWGWATWSRAWQHFEPDGRKLAVELRQRKMVIDFDLEGRQPFFRMLKQQIAGKNNSWAIRWHASIFLAGMLTLYPGRSHVVNIGVDGSGTHCQTRVDLGDELSLTPTYWSNFPVQVDYAARDALGDYFRLLRTRLWWARLCRIIGLRSDN
jgi:hypothetical protein